MIPDAAAQEPTLLAASQPSATSALNQFNSPSNHMTTSDIIAIAAAAIAFITFVASLWQARITRIHNRLSVRPAMEIFCAKNQSAGYLIRIENHGLGPARIKSIILNFNGVEY